MKLSEYFEQFPVFHKWVKEKKLNPKDLTILTEFKHISSFKPLLKWIEAHKPTHSQGIQILELGGELLLMNKSLNPLLLKVQKVPLLIKHLKQLRHPESSFRDEQKSKIINRLTWPSSVQAKWIRQNDKGALSIQFKVSSMKDFKQKIQNLNSVYKHLNESSEKLWK